MFLYNRQCVLKKAAAVLRPYRMGQEMKEKKWALDRSSIMAPLERLEDGRMVEDAAPFDVAFDAVILERADLTFDFEGGSFAVPVALSLGIPDFEARVDDAADATDFERVAFTFDFEER